MASFFLNGWICLILIQFCKARFFQEGFNHHYVYKATSDFMGMHNVTTIMKFHVQNQNKSLEGNHLNVLWLDSFVQFSQSGQYAENPLQWNLSKPFLFTVSSNGIVLHVHVHPDEQKEVSMLKKVISSTFSANVSIQNDTEWTYTSTDSDHIGTLLHKYNAKRTGSGIQLHRYHRSVDHVERLHEKTMTIDGSGAVRSVDGQDNIILENRLHSDFETKRIPYPDEYVIETTEEGDIGIIKANADIKVKLLSKRRIPKMIRKDNTYHGLLKDSVLHPQATKLKYDYTTLEADIKDSISCCHKYPDKTNTNRTVCVNNLRQNVTSLNDEDYKSLVTKYLSRKCVKNDTECEDERWLFTDIVAREGSALSQRLVVRYVFQHGAVDEEAIRRALIHFTTIDNPIIETVSAVKRLCFGINDENHGTINITVTTQRSCLSLGVIAKALSKGGKDSEAEAILNKLHSWLYAQGDETPKHLRPKRSTINVDTAVSSEHLLSKFVLIHSLGNAAHHSSIPHLHEYAKPNARLPAWRRAALSALKFDKGNKTAAVLLESLTYDEVETVRATAMEQFLAHPLQHNFTKSVGDIMLSQHYSYPTVLRLKRAGDLNAVLLEFKVELPEVHWGKSVGNAKVGASFGVDMVNRMHLRIKPLSGFFHINIWDRVYAEAHVGILGIRVDILRIETCYRGKLEYNMNILKDFAYGEAQADFDEYDKAAGHIVSPIVQAVEGITGHFNGLPDNQSLFDPLIASVKDIPIQSRPFLNSSLSLLSVVDRYQGLPLVSRAKLLAFKLQALSEDVNIDRLNFYNEIADIVQISLPHAETQITESANMIVEAQKKLGKQPQQAFETINMAKQRIKYATFQLIKAKTALQDALSPHGGSLPTWISSQDIFEIDIAAADKLAYDIESIMNSTESMKDYEKPYFVKYEDLSEMMNALKQVDLDMNEIDAGVKNFQAVVLDAFKKIQSIKLSVDELDKKTKETQNFVKKYFGSKFNLAFPSQRRAPDDTCEQGIWNSTTGGRYNDTPGIDLVVEYRSKVFCPVNGKVFRTCNHDEVRIVPTQDEFKMFTVFIRNIQPVKTIDVNGSEFKAGQEIGFGRGKSGCRDPYIHLAMRKDAENDDTECSFIDPSSYVDNVKPFPKWQEECKEFIFKHIDHIIEAGLSGLGFEDIIEELAKRALAWAGAEVVQKIVSNFPKSQMAKMAGTMTFAYLSQYNSEIANVFLKQESQAQLMDKKCEEMKQITTTEPTITRSNPHPPTSASVPGKAGVDEVLATLNDTSMQNSTREINDVLERLQKLASGIQIQDISSMAFSKYGKILHKLNIPFKGSKQSMEITLQMLTWNVCPTFENGISQGYGHLCIPSEDCFGLNCTVRFPDGIKNEKIPLMVLFERNDLEFNLLLGNNVLKIKTDDPEKISYFTNLMPAHDVYIISHANTVNISAGQAFQLSLSAIVCTTDAQCLPEVDIFHRLTFLKHTTRHKRSSGNGCSLTADVGIDHVGHIGGSLDVDKDGHVSGGGVDVGVQIGKTELEGGFHANDQGEWGTSFGADVDLENGNSVEAGMYLEGYSDGLTIAAAVEAEFGDKGSIGGFIEGNTDGEITAEIQGNVNIGSTNVSAAGWLHHDENGTSGGGMIDANFNGHGHLGASVNASSNGTVDARLSGSAHIGKSTISGTGYVHHDKNGTSGGGVVDANINNQGHISASINASSNGTVDAGLSGSAQIGNFTISGSGSVHHDKNGTSGTIHRIEKRTAKNCSVDISATFGNGKIDIGAEAEIPGLGNIGIHTTFKDGQLQGDIRVGDFSIDLGDVQQMSMDMLSQFASDLNINSDTTGIVSGLRDGMSTSICKGEVETSFTLTTEFGEEDFPARDRKDGVLYKDKHIDITIFDLNYKFGVGPINIKLEFRGGAAIGTDMWSDVQANKGTSAFQIGPWVSGMVKGGITIELGVASGGLELTGYLLKTKFPVTMETKSNKHPLTVIMNIDLELTPIELRLRGWAKVFFSKVFDKCLWKWACPPITWNVLRKELQNKDKKPPEFLTGPFCPDHRKGNTSNIFNCSLRQIPNRHPTDTAFQLEVSVTDDDSSIKTWYAIGRSPGGTDVRDWTKFKGDNQIVPCKLPNGILLHFTVKAKNQQGLESFVQCKLLTYDNTLPDGRVEASCKLSSHPSKITATVFVYEDSPIANSSKALGLSPGFYGREINDWSPLKLSETLLRSGVSSELKHFSFPRKGKLIVQPLATSISRYPEICARKCLDLIQCLSFDFDHISEKCHLHTVVESHTNKLHTVGDFKNYERLGGGLNSFIVYNNQKLEHGTVYYVNVLIVNTLKYRSAIFSEGTLVDFTPPTTGYLGNTISDVIVSHLCKASIRQRCDEVTGIPNHRMIKDGPESRTVFNGNKPLQDTIFTLTNHFVTANWDGFEDTETGIWGFTWAVGSAVCGQDIVKFEDPHSHISSPKYWTYSGYNDNVALKDGQYYVTVEALNNVVCGGALVTTVCHTVPFTIDTTPPLFHNVTDVMFDEDFDILAAYYNVSDDQSGISRIDFGLGMTKHDVGLRAYSRHDFMNRIDPYLVIENLMLQPGIPAWVRLRAVNKVGLFASGHANAPIMVDKTPPIPGLVYDGNELKEDMQYQHDTTEICAQWKDFFDPESGIRRFIWGVGSRPELDDILAFRNVSKFERNICTSATLHHNTTYFSTIIALNDALNSRRSNSSSDGVLVDITPPLPGQVIDRNLNFNEPTGIEFTSETASVAASWSHFVDQESKIDHYDINIDVNNETTKSLSMARELLFTDHSLTLHHLDTVQIEVLASNGAQLQTSLKSDGVLVDHTPPNLHFIHDTYHGSKFQSDKTKLNLGWHFSDPESGIAEYRYKVEEIDAGVRTTVYPSDDVFQEFVPKTPMVSLTLNDLYLKDGALYKVHIVAFNKARLSSSHESDGVLIDTTPPIVKNIKLCMPNEDEDLDETDTYVLLAGADSLTVSWLARDSESGVDSIKVGIGEAVHDTSVTKGYVTFKIDETHAILRDLTMQYFSDDDPHVYYVSVIAINKAGLQSDIATSKPIKVLHTNVPGVVYDGRQHLQDRDFTRDKTSLGISFTGFKSETCNIVGYEWAVGTSPYLTNIVPFTDYGVVMVNESEGVAQINVELFESQIYYATVRARTGEMCRQQFITSVSDGIILDRTNPELALNLGGSWFRTEDIPHQLSSVYQQSTDNIEISWTANDLSGLGLKTWSIGSIPGGIDIHNITESSVEFLPLKSVLLKPGKANFVTYSAKDKAANQAWLTSPAVIADETIPVIGKYYCSRVISSVKARIDCEWSMISDSESPITSVSYGISSKPMGLDILNFTEVSIERRNWHRNLAEYTSESNATKIYMALRIANAAGHVVIQEKTTVIDRTPPSKGRVRILTQETSTSRKTNSLCQISEQFIEIEIRGFEDRESKISRYEIALGTSPGKTDLQAFKDFGLKQNCFVDKLQLNSGMTVFASVKVFNEVGLFQTGVSQGIVISPSPKLSVIDGDSHADKDFTSELNLLQGSWMYSDPCPIITAEWSVEDLAGVTVKEFKPINNKNPHFFNDELQLENGKTYINVIRVLDSLNRIKHARSDGITVRIQPPTPSFVRDGQETIDENYQRSLTEIYGNWDEFGDTSNKNPSQRIVRYEVAVGDDKRFSKTRYNIHPFVNVGLNRTIVFGNLKLKPKLVRYYLTVRVYSAAGSFVEGYSNGIMAGYEEVIKLGYLTYSAFQSSDNCIEVGWSDFASDYGIRQYKYGVSTTSPKATNVTVDCSEFESLYFDVKSLSSVGLNTFAKIESLTLQHGNTYFVTVLAEDESVSCIAVTSGPILIDITKPKIGTLFLNDRAAGKRFNFIRDSNLKVSLVDFFDPESDISHYDIQLFELDGCNLQTKILVQQQTVNISTVSFYNIRDDQNYMIGLTVTNRAKLSNSVISSIIFFDKTEPLAGLVKPGFDWKHAKPVQNSLTTLEATVLVAKTRNAYSCPLQTDISPFLQHFQKTWHPLTGIFSPECITQEPNRLGIEVRADKHVLSKIVKGGVESKQMKLQEGVYSFTIKGLIGDQMVSSISVVGDFSAIPFEFSDGLFHADKGSSLNTSHANETYGNKSEGTENASGRMRYGSGFFIPGYKFSNGTNSWDMIFWAADMYNIQFKKISLDFDPTYTEGKYDLAITKVNDTELETWDVTFSVNEIEKASINALQFRDVCSITILGYNKGGYLPPVEDLFNPFYSEMSVSKVLIPNSKTLPCRYGNPFYDDDSGVFEIWVGVSNTENETETVMQYALQRRYCLPCRENCPYICDFNCTYNSANELEILPIKLSNLTLLPSSNTSDESNKNVTSGSDFDNLATNSYFINVKVVDFAGNVKETSSDAIIIDDTPPHFTQIACVDPDHSLDEAALYQGTNSSLAAFWNCEDDISQIEKYSVCVGTSAGACDIRQSFDNGRQSSVRIDELNGLENGNTYFITVNAYNQAFLKTSESCNITIELTPPVTERSTSNEMFSLSVSNGLPDVAFSDRTDRLGIQWDSNSNDTEFYEWSIGSSDIKQDIFPRVKIGTKMSKKAAVIDGHLWLDGININTTVKEYVLTNWTEEDIAEARAHGKFFNFEPGRCVHVNLYSVNRAHLSSKIPVKPICMKRKNDVFINFENQSLQSISVTDKALMMVQPGVSDDTNNDMTIRVNGTSGGLLVGLLDENDLNGLYGSSATDDYRPFIASPREKLMTSRLLRKRIQQYSPRSFYMSPVGRTRMDDLIEVSLHFNHSNQDTKPALIFWDQVEDEWKKVTEECKVDEEIDYNRKIYTTKVCLTAQTSTTLRRKRSLSLESDVYGPRQFSLVFISNNVAQSSPIIQTTSLTYIEDEATVSLKVIDIFDAEDDNVTFTLTGAPKHGFANITADGKLFYKADANYSGEDEIKVECVETTLPGSVKAQPVQGIIHIFVTEVNDAPDLIFIRGNDTFQGNRMMKVVLPMESNVTDYFIGTFFASDIDHNDSLTENIFDSSTADVNLTLTTVDDEKLIREYVASNNPSAKATKLYQLKLTMSKDFFGIIDYGLIVHDISGHWSLPIKLSIGVLYNPCVYGKCSPRGSQDCEHFSRARSFANYYCNCQDGYEGRWCEVETNECAPEPCALMFDCEDLVAGFRCNINMPKLMAILVCSLLAIGAVCFLIYRKKQQLKKRMKVSDIDLHSLTKNISPIEHFTRKYGKDIFKGAQDNKARDGSDADDGGADGGAMDNTEDGAVVEEIVPQGIELVSAGMLAPPHQTAAIYTRYKHNLTTIDT